MRLSVKESDIVRTCLDWLALHHIMTWRANNTGIYDPIKKIYRGFHGLRGVSDILGILPAGVFLAVEVKRPGQKSRPDQEAFLSNIRDRGGVALCVHSLRELEDMMRPHIRHTSTSQQKKER